jgi:hypothetical protein
MCDLKRLEEKLDLVLAELAEIKAQIGFSSPPPQEKAKTMTPAEVAEMFNRSIRQVSRREGIFAELKPAFKHPISFFRTDVERLYRLHYDRAHANKTPKKLLSRTAKRS